MAFQSNESFNGNAFSAENTKGHCMSKVLPIGTVLNMCHQFTAITGLEYFPFNNSSVQR